MTVERRLAIAAGRCAARLMPAPHRRWAAAMEHELAYISGDRAALRWAIGCVGTAAEARLQAMHLLDVGVVRAGGMLLALYSAFDAVLPTALTVAYRLQARGAAQGMATLTPGDDVSRLVPLIEAIPGWIHGLLIVAAACFLAATVALAGRRRWASGMLVLGVGVGYAAHLLARPYLAAVGVRAVADPSAFSSVILPFVLPLAMAVAAWSGSEKSTV